MKTRRMDAMKIYKLEINSALSEVNNDIRMKC
jgi:hypothetical protein